MEESYKNILANKYMRDTNYVIIKDHETLDELNTQWESFLSNMTFRQQRLSDDKSIQIWNLTNKQHYEIQKQKFLEDMLKQDIRPDKVKFSDKADNTLPEEELADLEIDTDVSDDLSSFTEDNNISVKEPDMLTSEYDRLAEKSNNDSDLSIMDEPEGKTNIEKLTDLENNFVKFNSQDNDLKRKADDRSREKYGGMSNLDRYKKLKSEYLSNMTEEELKESYKCIDSESVDKVLNEDSFVGKCYSMYKHNHLNEAINYQESKKLDDTPYFTPMELIDLGVHGNNNYYSDNPDNNSLTDDISISNWFTSYRDMSMNHIFEDYRKEWISKMNELYSGYYDIKDEQELLSRKQSILDLGWNPEIPFTNENRIKASDRVNEIFNNTIPRDIFIDINTVPECEESTVGEAVDNTQEPVFLLLTKGKTPILSDGIKFFTKSEYSHSSISFDPELEEVYSYNMKKDENFGFVKENIKKFSDVEVTVFAFFCPKDIIDKLKATIYDFANHKTTYDVRILWNKIFKINRKVSNDNYKQVCSTFVDNVLRSGNINITGDNELPAPSDIYDGAKSQPNKIFEIFNGLATKFNGSKIKNQINYLRNNQDTLSINEACKDLKSAIESQIKWENENDGDPDEDWSDEFKGKNIKETVKESTSILNEAKKFPIEFDDAGNLTIYKCRMGNISYGDEIDDSSELLTSYRNTNNVEGMKYEVARLWFLISDIEKKMTKRVDSDKYNEYVRNRSTAMNMFKHNIEYLMKIDKDFNFANYYNTTPFSDNSVKISNNTLKYSMKALKDIIMM